MKTTALVALLFSWILLAFISGAHAPASSHSLIFIHPATGEEASVSIMLVGNHYSRPLAAIFPSGHCLWTEELFTRQRIPMYNTSLTESEKREVNELVYQVIKDIAEIEITNGASISEAVEIAHNDDVVRELRAFQSSLKHTLGFETGELAPPTLTALYQEIHSSGVLLRSQGNSGGELVVTYNQDGFLQSMRGPIVYPVRLNGDFKWNEDRPFNRNWIEFVSLLLNTCKSSSPNGRQDILMDWNWKTPLASERVQLSVSNGLGDTVPHILGMKATQALEIASRLAHSESDSARAYLETILHRLPLSDRSHVMRTLGYYCIREGDIASAYNYFGSIANKEILAPAEILAESTLRAGYLAIRLEQRSQALGYFGRIATGHVPAEREIKEEATVRFAALLHRAKRGDEAIAAYTELATHGSLENSRHALLQIAGLLFEKGKGDYGAVSTSEKRQLLEETRNVCQMLFENDENKAETRAIAELMYLETYFYEDDYATCATLAAGFESKWSVYELVPEEDAGWNPSRQICTAQVWELLCNFKLGRYQKTIEICQDINSGRWAEDDPYPAFNAFAYAYVYEAFAHHKLGSSQKAKELLATCEQEYPRWYWTIGRREATENGFVLEELSN
jgi:hypothetical protein